MIWPLSLLTRASKGSDLIPTEADTLVSSIQKAVNAAQVGWGHDESTSSGLTWGYLGGQGWSGTAWSTVAGGTLALTASATNYIERTVAGVVSVNQTGWTSGRIPMFKVVTSSSGVSSWTDMRGASVPLSMLGTANGVPTLDGTGKVPTSMLPALAITDTYVVASQAAMLALAAQQGDVAIRTDLGSEAFILTTSDPTTLANWQAISPMQLSNTTPTSPGAGTAGSSTQAARGDHQHPQPYDIAGGYIGKPTASAVGLRHVAARAFTLPASLTGSYAKAGTAAAASTTFNVAKNGTNFGTIVFAASGTTATFTGTATSFAAGDVLTVTAPGTPDTALADIAITLAGSMA